MNEITYDKDSKICAIRNMQEGTIFYFEGNWYILTDELSEERKYATVVDLATGKLEYIYRDDKAEVFSGILHINCR